jgi:cation transport regulator ChaB
MMPYETLPERLRALIPSSEGQEIFRRTFNSQLADGKTEEVAFASAWASLQRAGYERGEDGKWMKKTQPTAAQVHVDGAEWDDEEKGRKKPRDYYKASGAKPLYMYRSVLNAEQLHDWAREQGFVSALMPDDMHVTVVFSRSPFSSELTEIAESHGQVGYGNVVIRGGRRAVAPLGDKGAVVLKIQSDDLQREHTGFREMGASWDFQEYTPHITITYRGTSKPPADIQPFAGDIVLGPLRAKPLNPNWDSQIHETVLNPSVEKAEYQGRTVTLDKPFRLPAGSSKKFGVYVKDGDRVKRVTFGDPNMDIRRDDPQARANFRARHSCDTATDKTTARYWSCRMWTAGATVSDTVKRMMNDDSFTHAAEAAVRSMDLGLEGRIHVHQTADGQAVYMPGETHDEYLAQMATHADIRDSLLEEMEEGAESSPDLLQRAISAIIDAVMEHDLTKASDILKIDRARRIVWGWASVSTIKGEIVTDLQGDRIAPAEMEKMADRFMRSARAAKAMHDGDDVGEVLHSFPVTEKLAKAFGIAIDREGWITGTYIKSDDEWAKVLRGEYRGLSIGGRAKRRKA